MTANPKMTKNANRRPVRACPVPAGSRIEALLAGSYFHDAWCVDVDDATPTALDHLLVAMRSTPAWIDAMMQMRNRAVALAGLKNLGGLAGIDPRKPALDYVSGDRVGVFSLIENSPDEVLVGDDDKHLRVVLSVCRRPAPDSANTRLVLTTVVHVHNLLGRLYMLPVAPMHKLIAPAVLARV